MKTTEIKTAIVSWLATIIAIGGFSLTAGAQTTATTVKYSPSFKQEKAAINKDLNNINQQQERIKALKKQCKAERQAGIKDGATHSSFLKAKADLKRNKAYLRADKKGLVMEHQAHVKAHRELVNSDRAELRGLKRQLDADLAAGNNQAVGRTRQILELKQDLRQHEVALKNAETSRNSDMAVINKEIRDYNGESNVLLVPESSAKNQTVALK